MTQKPLPRWQILVCIGLTTFMADLDASIVNVALPRINQALATTMRISELIISSYLITICVFLLFSGKLGDTFGKANLFKIGMIIFTLGSLFCGLSTTITWLLVARFVQAVGAAMTMSTNNGIITEIFPTSERGQALGWIGSFVALGMITGPGIGGVLLTFFPWQAIFWINVPIGIVLTMWGFIILPVERSHHKTKLDWQGILFNGLSLTGFFGYIYAGQQVGYTNGWLVVMLLAAIILMVAFVYHEQHMAAPLLDFSLFYQVDFTIGIITAILIFIANNFYMVLMPFYLENAKLIGVCVSGLIMMMLPVVQVIVAPISGRLADRFGTIQVTLVGAMIILLAQLGLICLGLHTSLAMIGAIVALLGLGNAIFQSPNNSMIMGAVIPTVLGVAGSINSLSRNLGMVLGNALATSLLFISMSRSAHATVTNFEPRYVNFFITGQRQIYGFGTGLLVVVFALIVWRKTLEKKGN
ncbi:MFS transporter [Furfurilactobacillus entadae]|uniref:MFS transporter n=1 Tax=Furfurilactobacillus entadae TaxID=2922307 RepID=UPI0035E74D26